MILQSIPIISPLNPISAILPFVFVIAVSMTREGCEDCKRHRSDRCKFYNEHVNEYVIRD